MHSLAQQPGENDGDDEDCWGQKQRPKAAAIGESTHCAAPYADTQVSGRAGMTACPFQSCSPQSSASRGRSEPGQRCVPLVHAVELDVQQTSQRALM